MDFGDSAVAYREALLIRRGFVDLVRRSATGGIRATGLTSFELAATGFGSSIRLVVVLGSRASDKAQHRAKDHCPKERLHP